jgi:hypothetical protein
MRGWLALALLALAQPALAQAPACDTLESPAGQSWAQANAWRYADAARAAAIFRDLADSPAPSSWPDGIPPEATVLPVGTRFQMAVANFQLLPDGTVMPGGWGTFRRIDTVAQARDDLAIRSDFKASLDHVLTFEVTAPLPALIGPTGPQVELSDCHLLPGGWMQLQMLVLPADRMHYLRVVEIRAIH